MDLAVNHIHFFVSFFCGHPYRNLKDGVLSMVIPWNQKTMEAEIQKTLPKRHTAELRFPMMHGEHNNIQKKQVLGIGGMGTVYLAEQKFPFRNVAVKQANNDTTTSQATIFQEAMIAGGLEHPSIVPIYEVQHSEIHGPEIIMKRIEGQTFLELIQEKQGKDGWIKRAFHICIAICQALEYVHSKRILHRDIKPENIMLGRFGEVYLLDWGLAVPMDNAEHLPKGICGSLQYMPPEMLLGDPSVLDERTDIFLLGATLHEAITGEARYSGTSMEDIKEQIRRCKEKVINRENGEMIGAIINKACARNPNDRYQSMQDFRTELELFLERREAVVLRNMADKERSTLEEGLKKQLPAKLLFPHFHRARFAYERALEIWNEDMDSKKGLFQLLMTAIQFHLSRHELDVVEQLFKYAKPNSSKEKDLFMLRHRQYESMKHERRRLESIASKYDFFPSMRSLIIVVITFVSIAVIALSFLKPLQQLDASLVSPALLFYHSIFYLFPVALFLILGRELIQKNLAIRKVVTAIFGSIFIVMLHRWIAMEQGDATHAIIAVDFFILGVGFASCSPILSSGLFLAVISIGIGMGTYLFPQTVWMGTLGFTLSTIILLGFDGWRMWISRK